MLLLLWNYTQQQVNNNNITYNIINIKYHKVLMV